MDYVARLVASDGDVTERLAPPEGILSERSNCLPAAVAPLHAQGRSERAELLARQLALERSLAERQLHRSTRPVCDPLDVVAAKLAEVVGATALPVAGPVVV